MLAFASIVMFGLVFLIYCLVSGLTHLDTGIYAVGDAAANEMVRADAEEQYQGGEEDGGEHKDKHKHKHDRGKTVHKGMEVDEREGEGEDK